MMLKELSEQLAKEIKEKVPGVNITAGQAASITVTTLQVMEDRLWTLTSLQWLSGYRKSNQIL